MIEVLKAKIHRATVKDANLKYEGSITICEKLMKEAGIREYEKVMVADINNGNRFETYAIRGKENVICVNGAASRLVCIGDKVIIMAYRYISEDKDSDEKELEKYQPRIVMVDDNNRINK